MFQGGAKNTSESSVTFPFAFFQKAFYFFLLIYHFCHAVFLHCIMPLPHSISYANFYLHILYSISPLSRPCLASLSLCPFCPCSHPCPIPCSAASARTPCSSLYYRARLSYAWEGQERDRGRKGGGYPGGMGQRVGTMGKRGGGCGGGERLVIGWDFYFACSRCYFPLFSSPLVLAAAVTRGLPDQHYCLFRFHTTVTTTAPASVTVSSTSPFTVFLTSILFLVFLHDRRF